MSLTQRMWDITRAHWNEELERRGDPLEQLDRLLAEAARNLREWEGLIHRLKDHVMTLQHRIEAGEQWCKKREGQACLALEAGEEELARLALAEKARAEDEVGAYRRMVLQALKTLEQAETQWLEMERVYREMASKRGLYRLRMESLQLQQRLTSQPGAFRSDPFISLQRLEEEFADREREWEALQQLRRAWDEPEGRMF